MISYTKLITVQKLDNAELYMNAKLMEQSVSISEKKLKEVLISLINLIEKQNLDTVSLMRRWFLNAIDMISIGHKLSRHKYWPSLYNSSSSSEVWNLHGLKFIERKNGVILTYKVESLAELKFNQGFRVNLTWVKLTILRVNLNWLSISSQFDSNIQQLLGIPGRILVPPVTQLYRSKWLHFFFQYMRTKETTKSKCIFWPSIATSEYRLWAKMFISF